MLDAYPQISGKHKIVSCRSYDRQDLCSGTTKTVMPKTKFIAARNLKDWTKFYHSK